MGIKEDELEDYKLLYDSARYRDYRKIINKYQTLAYMEYTLKISKEIINIMPLVSEDGSVILGNDKSIQTEIDTIKKYSNIVCAQGKSIKDKQGKREILNQILAYMIGDIIQLVRCNPIGYLISFMSQLEYNRFMASGLVLWSQKSIQEKTKDELMDRILYSLSFFERYKDYMTGLHISNLYVGIESFIAAERSSLESVLEIIMYIITKYVDKLEDTTCKYRFIDILEIARGMTYIQTLKMEITEGEYKDKELVFNDAGEIVLKADLYSKVKRGYYEYVTDDNRYKRDLDPKNKIRIGKIAKRYLGVDVMELEEMLDKLKLCGFHNDEFLVGSIEEWKKLFIKHAKSVENGNRFFSYMNSQIDIEALYKETSIRKSKASRRCLLPIEQVIICPVNLLQYSVMNIYLDILSGEVWEQDLKKEIKKVLQNEDKQFEIDVFLELKDKFKEGMVKYNILENEIEINKRKVILPGEIDVLFLYKGKIFVIECKNIGLKVNTKARINTKNKLSEDKSKSPQVRLKSKVDKIKEFKSEIIMFMGADLEEYIQGEVKGVFVSSAYIDIEDKISRYPIISFEKLVHWIDVNS